MATSSDDTDMLDAPLRNMEQLVLQEYDEVLKRHGLSDQARIRCGIDFGTKYSSINYGQAYSSTSFSNCKAAPNSVTDVNGSYRIETVAAFLQKTDDTNNTTCELVFGARAHGNPAHTGHKLLAKIDLFKLSLISEYAEVSQDPAILGMTRELKAKHKKLIDTVRSATPEGKYRVLDPLTGKYNTHTLQSIHCVIREFLRFLWQSTKADFAKKNGLQADIVTRVFREKVDAAISVPTISTWEDTAMDDLRTLLHEAGFPKTTCICSEPQAAILYYLLEVSKTTDVAIAGIAMKEIMIICDIGGGTTDISCLVPCKGKDKSNTGMREAFPGVGSFQGSQNLNERFKQYVKQQFPAGVLHLVSGFKGSELDVLDAFAEGFEEEKKEYSGTKRKYIIRPRFDVTRRLKALKRVEFVMDSDKIILEPSVLEKIFDAWLKEIKNMLREYLEEVKAEYKGKKMVIGLNGWGSLPPYVLSQLRLEFEKDDQVAVRMMETQTDSAVAQGNYLRLMSLDFNKVQQARASFGIDGCDPVVSQDANLCGSIKYKAAGNIHLKNPVFPLEHHLYVKSYIEFGPSDSAGVFELKIPSLERGGFRLQWTQSWDGSQPSSYLDLQYQLELHLEELMPRLELTIPYSGRLDSIHRTLGEDMTWSIPLKSLYKHVASMKSRDEGEEKLDDEGIDFDLGSVDAYAPGPNDYHGWFEQGNFQGSENDMMDIS